MSVNKSHAGKGVLIYSGEAIILYCDHVGMEFSGSLPSEMRGNKTGRLYLTTHRILFNNDNAKDALQSFCSPFFCLSKVDIEQPVFGANYIKGFVKAQENGGFYGEVKFKLTFKHGGAIEFGTALLRVASMATQHVDSAWREAPPPYSPPEANWAAAPPPAYSPPQAGYYGWAPPTQTFPDRPPTDGVFMYETPPPYPGLGGNGSAPPAGFSVPPNPKAQEASGNQTAYFDPNNPQFAYVAPPPPYGPSAPFDYTDKKKDQ